MTASIFVDTDVMVDYLRGRTEAVTFVDAHADRLATASIVVAELYAGVRGEGELAVVDEAISAIRIVPLTAEIARMAGLLKRDYGKSHGVGLSDAILAATVQHERGELATLNVKHYPMFKGLLSAYSKA